jgi:hypothetical protein
MGQSSKGKIPKGMKTTTESIQDQTTTKGSSEVWQNKKTEEKTTRGTTGQEENQK